MNKKYDCNKCENGYIKDYGFIENGLCWKCQGTGKLNYEPSINAKITYNKNEYADFLEHQKFIEQEMKSERDAFMAVNNMFECEEDNYYFG